MASKRRKLVFVYTAQGEVPKNVTHVEFAPDVQIIDARAFFGCMLLESITIPPSITIIGYNAFRGCSSLKVVVINEGLRTIESGAFSHCLSLESITIPSSVATIGSMAFRYCQNLKVVVFNEGIQMIYVGAFCRCPEIESITIPSSVTTIGSMAFRSCRNLKVVVFIEGVKSIDTRAFMDCSSLESITIPCSVTSIERGAFHDCSSLREVMLNDGNQRLGTQEIPKRFAAIRDTITVERRLEIENSANAIPGIATREGEITISHVAIIDNWTNSRGPLIDLLGLISYHELKEATTSFELALWKSKIEERGGGNDAVNRELCRIEVPGPVKDAVLQFFTYQSSS